MLIVQVVAVLFVQRFVVQTKRNLGGVDRAAEEILLNGQFCKVNSVLCIAHFVGCPKIPFMAYASVPVWGLLDIEIDPTNSRV
jgi:hypothetical protein